jgi:hypothetical protein
MNKTISMLYTHNSPLSFCKAHVSGPAKTLFKVSSLPFELVGTFVINLSVNIRALMSSTDSGPGGKATGVTLSIKGVFCFLT